jgi:UrcA family protein
MKTYHSIYYVAAACLTVEAHAHEMEPRRAEVHYRDLNLSTPSGRERLHNRVELAVKRLCEQTGVGNFSDGRNASAAIGRLKRPMSIWKR